jgi:hypothetical protein
VPNNKNPQASAASSQAEATSPPLDGWSEHEQQQRENWLRTTTPAQRLAWLEEAMAFANQQKAKNR